MERQGTGINVTGIKETMHALRVFEPEVHKAMRKRIRVRLKSVARGAAGRYGGIYKVAIRDSGKRAGGSIIGDAGPREDRNDWSSPATRAVIFEFARNGKTPQARAAIASFDARFGAPGRFMWEEWDSQGGDAGVGAEIEAEIRDAERTLQRNLDAAGESY